MSYSYQRDAIPRRLQRVRQRLGPGHSSPFSGERD